MELQIQPGILCMVRRGLKFGLSVTAIRLAEPGEVEAILSKRFGAPIAKIAETSPIWLVDKPMTWKHQQTGGQTDIPYGAAANLLPIPPLADDEQEARARWLELSS